MKVQIHAQEFTLTEGLRAHIERRLAHALSHGRDVVTCVIVRLTDLNGPRGGADKRCGIEVRHKRASPVVVEDVQSDLYVAIDRASERVRRTLDRRLAYRRAQPATRQGRDMRLPWHGDADAHSGSPA